MKKRRGFAFALLCFLASQAQAQERQGKELLQFAIDSHRASRELIRTLSCSVSYKWSRIEPPTTETGSSRHWQSPDAVRVTLKEDLLGKARSMDYVWKNGKRKGVFSKPTSMDAQASGAGLSEDVDRHVHRLDAFTRALLTFQLPGTIRELPLEAVVDAASKVESIAWTDLDGQKVVFLRLRFDEERKAREPSYVEVYLEGSLNYLARKVAYFNHSDTQRREHLVVELKEFPGGILFPTRVEEQLLQSRKPWGQASAVISEIKVNQPLPNGIFELRYPHGVWLTDSINKELYQVDSEGRRISKARPLAGKVVPPPGIESLPQTVIGEETKEEPVSLASWILPASMAVLLVSVVVCLVRRFRATRQEA